MTPQEESKELKGKGGPNILPGSIARTVTLLLIGTRRAPPFDTVDFVGVSVLGSAGLSLVIFGIFFRKALEHQDMRIYFSQRLKKSFRN